MGNKLQDAKSEFLDTGSTSSGIYLGTGTRIERLKRFKLSGAIGNPGEKGKLTCSSFKTSSRKWFEIGIS